LGLANPVPATWMVVSVVSDPSSCDTCGVVYEHDPNALPDSAFVEGSLGYLRVGNEGRMLDPRRTPVTVTGVYSMEGVFELEVTAFEDCGARWMLPVEDVSKFQFGVGSLIVPNNELAALESAVERFHKDLKIEVDPDVALATQGLIDEETAVASSWLTHNSRYFSESVSLNPSVSEGPPKLRSDLARYMESRLLSDIEHVFASTWVSNPSSGEVVKGHRIAIARLGLAPYAGLIPRLEASTTGRWRIERRSDHIVARIGFVRAMFTHAEMDHVVLYRGLSFEQSAQTRTGQTLISATFHQRIADARFDTDPHVFSVSLMRQPVPITRLFMTYFETDAMNSQFSEAEAVLLQQPTGPLF